MTALSKQSIISAFSAIQCDVLKQIERGDDMSKTLTSAGGDGFLVLFVSVKGSEILDAVVEAMQEPAEQVLDLHKIAFDSLIEAASESAWIPPEYFMNDWLSDCAAFLRTGKGISE